MQETPSPRCMRSMQAWLQAMQMRTSCSRPSAALAGISGSQIIARVMPTMSACPEAMTCSAVGAWLMRPTAMTGWVTCCLSAAAKGAVSAVSVPIGGTMKTAAPIWREEPEVTLK